MRRVLVVGGLWVLLVASGFAVVHVVVSVTNSNKCTPSVRLTAVGSTLCSYNL